MTHPLITFSKAQCYKLSYIGGVNTTTSGPSRGANTTSFEPSRSANKTTFEPSCGVNTTTFELSEQMVVVIAEF